MTDLREHLTDPFEDGGHGYDPEGYSVHWFDLTDLHEHDHDPDVWFQDVITHNQNEAP